jgi:hypothetical protein
MQLLATAAFRDNEPGILEHAQVLHHPETCHRESLLQLAERLAVPLEELVEQLPARRIRECLEGPSPCLNM